MTVFSLLFHLKVQIPIQYKYSLSNNYTLLIIKSFVVQWCFSLFSKEEDILAFIFTTHIVTVCNW